MTIPALIPSQIQGFLDRHEVSEQPTLYEFPDVLQHNLDLIDDLPVQVYVAHKPTKSQEMIRAAHQAGHGVDVSSLGELQNAENADIPPEEIEATGPKNTLFIDELLQRNILISVDSLAELRYIADQDVHASVQLRVANPIEEIGGTTKFGIKKDQLVDAKAIVEDSKARVEGFHYHGDGLTARLRANVVSSFLSLIENHFPRATKINVGGGFRAQRLRNPTDWSKHIQSVVEGLKQGSNETWSQTPYGLHVTRDNTVQGREKAMLPGNENTLRSQLTAFLDEDARPRTTVADIIHDTDISIIIEPGHALLHNTAIASLPVEHTKETPNGPLTVVNAHTFMLSTHMSPPRATPRLTPRGEEDTYETFIGGLLCRNDDVFTTRPVTLHRQPRRGDNLVFFNQGAYASYEQGTPQLHHRINTEVVHES
mgnify:CR=1 FL=1